MGPEPTGGDRTVGTGTTPPARTPDAGGTDGVGYVRPIELSYINFYPGREERDPGLGMRDSLLPTFHTFLRGPLGLAVVGGLLLSQVVPLHLIPVVYSCLAEVQEWLHKRGAKKLEIMGIPL